MGIELKTSDEIDQMYNEFAEIEYRVSEQPLEPVGSSTFPSFSQYATTDDLFSRTLP